MAYDELLADRVRLALRKQDGCTEQQMFGGLGFMIYGNMSVGIWKESLVVRFDREIHEQKLRLPHVRPFDVTGREMKGWALVDAEGLASDDDLAYWVNSSVSFARTLPPK